MFLSRPKATGLAALSCVALAAAAFSAGPAVALAAAAPASHVPAFAHRLRHSGADNSWGGYAVTGTTFHSVTGNWVVPALNCSATAGDISFWSGIDGWTSSTVEQIGLDAVCTSGGKIEYNPWVEMYPANSIYFTETVHAGDRITASVSVSGTSFTLTETDTTQGWTKTYHKRGSDQLSSAEAILEDLGSNIPAVADFGSVDFTDVTANGAPLASAGTVNSTDIERGNTLLTDNSALNGGNFSINWLGA